MHALLTASGLAALLSLSVMACAAAPTVASDEPKLEDDRTKAPAETTKPAEVAKAGESKTTGGAGTNVSTPVEAPDDAGPALEPKSVCANPGAPVYAFEGEGNAWRYSKDPNGGLEGFAPRGIAFRGAPDDGEHVVVPIYLIRNAENGDYALTTVPTEGKNIGYGPVAEVAHVFLEPFPGSVPLTRYLQESPALRHRVSIDGAPEGWQAEPPRGFVCPR